MRRAIVVIALGALVSAYADEVMPPAVLSSPGGRFVFGQIGLARADQYLLDTTTGRVWRLVCTSRDAAGKCDAVALEIVPYLDGGAFPSATSQPKK